MFFVDKVLNKCRYSIDNQYRYKLHDIWEHKKGLCMFIGAFPGSSFEAKDDRHTALYKKFAKELDYGGVIVSSLYAHVKASFKTVDSIDDPIGPDNDKWLLESANQARMILAVWGGNSDFKGQDQHVLKLLRTNNFVVHCLGVTDNKPKHILQVQKNAVPTLLKG